jgi:hypothetical protein
MTDVTLRVSCSESFKKCYMLSIAIYHLFSVLSFVVEVVEKYE